MIRCKPRQKPASRVALPKISAACDVLQITPMKTKKSAAKTKGTAMAEKTRALANRMTDEERQHYLAKAIQVVYREGAKACVSRR